MEERREGNSTTRPPFLTDANYSLWKNKMKIYLCSIDRKVWNSIVTGWTPPTEVDEAGVKSIVPDSKWTAAQESTAQYNYRVLHVIFSAIEESQQKYITSCETAKEA